MIAEADVSGEFGRIDCQVLVTERLVLRQPHLHDVEDLAHLANDRRVADMLTRMPHPYGEAEAHAFVKLAGNPHRTEVTYALTIAATGAFIGCASLRPAAGGYDLGYWIGRPHWGKGFATEAAHALVDLTFRASNADLLTASCRVANTASQRVIHKCGFQYCGQGMLNSLAAGQVAVVRYRLDRKTWVGLRSWSKVGG